MRTGIRIRGERGHPVVRKAIIQYARWLRTEYSFPIRVPVYLKSGSTFTSMYGEEVVSAFFAPWDRAVEPYIRLATGGYPRLRREVGRDDALADYIFFLSEQVVRYQKWVQTGKMWERGVNRLATKMLRSYANSVRSPLRD